MSGPRKPRVPGAELETPTVVLGPAAGPEARTLIDEPAPLPPTPSLPAVPRGPGTVQMISMKAPDAPRERERPPVAVQLRAIGEASGRHFPTPPGGLGYLAPPRDPATAPRRRPTWLRVLGMAIGCLALAAAIALAIWFLS